MGKEANGLRLDEQCQDEFYKKLIKLYEYQQYKKSFIEKSNEKYDKKNEAHE